MDHESTRLTENERRILTEIENGLLGRRRTFRQLIRRGNRPRINGRTRRVCWTVVMLLGTSMLVVGLAVGSVWAAAAGFVAVLVGLHAVTADVTLLQALAGFARLLGLPCDERSRDTD